MTARAMARRQERDTVRDMPDMIWADSSGSTSGDGTWWAEYTVATEQYIRADTTPALTDEQRQLLELVELAAKPLQISSHGKYIYARWSSNSIWFQVDVLLDELRSRLKPKPVRPTAEEWFNVATSDGEWRINGAFDWTLVEQANNSLWAPLDSGLGQQNIQGDEMGNNEIPGETDIDKADSEYIIRVLNSHDDLVAALEAQSRIVDAQTKLLTAYRLGTPPSTPVMSELRKRPDVERLARAALAKAKGEQHGE